MKVVKKVEDKAEQSTIDTTGPGDRLDAFTWSTSSTACGRGKHPTRTSRRASAA